MSQCMTFYVFLDHEGHRQCHGLHSNLDIQGRMPSATDGGNRAQEDDRSEGVLRSCKNSGKLCVLVVRGAGTKYQDGSLETSLLGVWTLVNSLSLLCPPSLSVSVSEFLPPRRT